MAKASFFANDLKVRRKGEFLVIEARKKCQHGTIFDEVFLTVPAEWAPLFTRIDQSQNIASLQIKKIETLTLAERFERFSSEN